MKTPHDRFDGNDETSTPERGLEAAIELLREDVEPRDAWRAQLANAIAAESVTKRAARTWQLSPLLAIAAALACMVFGGATTMWWTTRGERVVNNETSTALQPVSTSNDHSIGVRFAVMAKGATRVSLVGDFNNWDADATPLRLADDGSTWVAMLPLRSGRHAYAFVIDGEVVADPSAPRALDEDFGTPSSLVLVSASR